MLTTLTVALVAAAVLSPFAKLASDAIAAYTQFVLDAAAGKEVDPALGLQLARDANRSAVELRDDVETAAARFELDQQYHSRDFNAEIQAAMQAYRDAFAEQERLKGEFERLQAQNRAAHERVESTLHRRSSLEAEQKRVQNEYSQAMNRTAGAGRDKTDWKNFKLS